MRKSYVSIRENPFLTFFLSYFLLVYFFVLHLPLKCPKMRKLQRNKKLFLSFYFLCFIWLLHSLPFRHLMKSLKVGKVKIGTRNLSFFFSFVFLSLCIFCPLHLLVINSRLKCPDMKKSYIGIFFFFLSMFHVRFFLILTATHIKKRFASSHMYITPSAVEPGVSIPQSQGLSNNPYPEPNQPSSSYWLLFL